MILSEEQRLEAAAMFDELRAKVGMFLAEFAAFESMYLTAVLHALSHDVTLVDFLEDLMDLEKRLRLLKRLAEAKQLPPALMAEVQAVRKNALKLLEHRNEVAHGAAVVVSTYAGSEFAGLTAGVRLPKSKRRLGAANDAAELYALAKSWHRTTPEVAGYIADTLALQHAAHQLAERLGKHMRGEPL